MSRSWAIIGTGIAAAGTAVLAGVYFWRKGQTVDAIQKAVAGESGQTVKLRLTGYWPFAAKSAKEKLMEGGLKDRLGKPLHTLEMHQSNPTEHPYVSCSGDHTIWPYGQRLIIPELGANLVYRIVDTGSHFFGAGKVVRVSGYEPLDVCVASSETKVPKLVQAYVVPGDHFAAKLKKGTVRDIAFEKLAGIVEGYTEDDLEALARMLASEFQKGTEEEMRAAAWATRNAAGIKSISIKDMLAPSDFGPQGGDRAFASTRLEATGETYELAGQVLDAVAEADPTGGACDFWKPEQQDRLKVAGDVYRAALKRNDGLLAGKYQAFRGYTKGASDMRSEYLKRGMRPIKTVGAIELMAKV
jgi:hypothetical protein